MMAPSLDFEEAAREWIRGAMLELDEHQAARVEPLVSGGNVADVLLGQATEADLLVVGNKGRGALAPAR
jgi:nucleotide-binding universal stress UspA family protein